jgi:alpha-2-macroglobulin
MSRASSRVMRILVAALAAASIPVLMGAGETVPPRPADATGTVIVPDHFLRRWDPVTVFFAADVGKAPGPEDRPESHVTLEPAHPGAWRWLDPRTLQFRPAEPWPTLARFTFKAGTASRTLATLMEPPEKTIPEAGAEGLEPVDAITLTFADPLDPAALSRMVSIELRPLPGVGSANARWLSRDDFKVKSMERAERGASATYVLALKEPIPLGTRAVVHFRLSLDDQDQRSFREIAFSTGEPFRVTGAGCRDRRYPMGPEGTRYGREQAIACTGGRRTVVLEFSATPREVNPVEGRNLVRLTPDVPNLTFALEGRSLAVSGDFAWDTLYGLAIAPAALVDAQGRPLRVHGRGEVFVHFPRQPAYVRWGASQGLVERRGAQMVPLTGRGEERLDLRIHKVEPLDRTYWPFPPQPVSTDDSTRPPGPGEEPVASTAGDVVPSPSELARRIGALGAPAVSTLVTLPLKREGGAARFGLDLAPHLSRIAGAGQSGTYLVGLRDLAATTQRAWMRVQVTDLSLSTLEEPRAVVFTVTSLSSALPVPGAQVRVEGNDGERWITLGEGVTGPDGRFRWPAPGHTGATPRTVRRLVVSKGDDVLVLDPMRPPDRYADNQWAEDRSRWLQWAVNRLDDRGPQPEMLAHVFTERPVYRPGDEVHVKGYVRRREKGRLVPVTGRGFVVVQGPGDLVWRYPAALGAGGSFYHRFLEKDVPTGEYHAAYEDAEKVQYGRAAFRIEAYRLPQFEVALHGPDHAALDRPFDVSLTATYYAGGRVAGQPVAWRVTQFPFTWSPKPIPGFRYSSDGRFSRTERFQSSPRLDRTDTTADDGSASLTLNPAVEPTAQPRTYVVEATVTGPDDQTVTATRSIHALPPFVLGVKAPRFLEQAREVAAEVVMVGPDGAPLPGRDMTVRLLRREWHSHLRASDFSDGMARYVTDVVDVKVTERAVKSGDKPVPVTFPLEKAGVYLVEVEARDRLQRAQVVRVDLYAGGPGAVAWPKPVTRVFSVATDKPRYDPGDSAAIILKSPFQQAHALAIVEDPDGNRYEWLPVEAGTAVYRVPVLGHFTPRLPVHFVLMRGRLPGAGPVPGDTLDLGKPATMAATAWVDVNPAAHRMTVTVEHPETARPGQTIEMKVTLKDPKGQPLAGEVTLWLVDQAVLALGKEARLDPVPDFLRPVRSHFSLADTRNLAFGVLPFAEEPGGDGGEEGGILDRATVRKNFKSVPYYNPTIEVGPTGVVVVKVTLSDDLTNFDVRAKAMSGPQRFGYFASRLPVRLPLIVQPALPRFVRPGDRFTAAAIGRVVEGRGGPGAAEVKAEGVTLEGAPRRDVVWVENRPETLTFPVTVPTPDRDAEGRATRDHVLFRVGVSRASDGATDAFEVKLPLRDDRERETRRVLADLVPGKPLSVPGLDAPARPGTLRRQVLLSDQPALVRMAAALDFFQEYPYGCTEQQTSRARSYVALRKLRALLGQKGAETEAARAVKDTLLWIPGVVDESGLVAYWPGSRGTVTLTAWTVQFLVEAKEAGFTVDQALLDRLVRSLQQALRSDYRNFVDGESFTERAWALSALAQAGHFDPAYASELARRAQALRLEARAEVLQAFSRAPQKPPLVSELVQGIAQGVVVKLFQGREVYGGLQDTAGAASGRILPSETRTVAEVARALGLLDRAHPRLPVLTQALVTLGRDDGWGSTNANAAALLALSELLQTGTGGTRTAQVRLDGTPRSVALGPAAPVASLSGTTGQAIEISADGAPGAAPLVARVETSWVPAADGSQAAAQSQGFVVAREWQRVRGEDEATEKVPLAAPGSTLKLGVGDVIEEHVQVVNPKERNYVAIVVPLAAGLEPLNPGLATAPPEAKTRGRATLQPTYVAMLDDSVAFYYDTLPAGTFELFFRTRATVPGGYIQPPAKAEMMYDAAVRGTSPGARVEVAPRP